MSNLILQKQAAEICVVRLSAIGDTCHALAVVRRIQDSWPESKVTWIIGKTEASLLADIPDVEFIIFDKSKGRRAIKDVRKALGDKHFDIALCMHASMRVNLLYRKLHTSTRLGFDRKRAKDFQWLFTNQRIPATDGEHALEAMMSFAKTIGAPPQPIRWDIPISLAAREFAAKFQQQGRTLVVISPCSSERARNFRNWSIENYRNTIAHLNESGCRVLLTGGASEQEREYGAALSESDIAENLIGQTTLKQLAALIAAADLVICPDSGPAHIATAMGTPVLGLYATTNPDRSGPYASREMTVNRYADAAARYLGKPVAKLRWGQRVRHPDAMNLIALDDVIGKIDSFLEIDVQPGQMS